MGASTSSSNSSGYNNFGYNNSLDQSTPSQDTTISPNKYLTSLDDTKTDVNRNVRSSFSGVRRNLQRINYYDNDIKKMQELLQFQKKL